MTVFTCDEDIDSMFTCIYDAWASKLGHKNIRLEFEGREQLSMFDEYIYVPKDEKKAASVADSINKKISPAFYGRIVYCAMAYESERLDTIYRMLLLGFHYGPEALNMYQYEVVVHFNDIIRRLGREANAFYEFVRFNLMPNGIYISHIEPKSHVLVQVGGHFADRMPSEHWMIVDDVHREAIVHPKNGTSYMLILTEEELDQLRKSERFNDEYTDLWKVFFDSIAIKERENRTCQLGHFPLWYRKHVTEFM